MMCYILSLFKIKSKSLFIIDFNSYRSQFSVTGELYCEFSTCTHKQEGGGPECLIITKERLVFAAAPYASMRASIRDRNKLF